MNILLVILSIVVILVVLGGGWWVAKQVLPVVICNVVFGLLSLFVFIAVLVGWVKLPFPFFHG